MTMVSVQMLGPVIALVAWSMIMWLWMYAKRIPAIKAANIQLDRYTIADQLASLPPKARWVADNYNHLMEQPTIFYAITLTLAMMQVSSSSSYYLAWFYVVVRVIHSVQQSLNNVIEVRFALFVLSNLALFGLTYIAIVEFLKISGM